MDSPNYSAVRAHRHRVAARLIAAFGGRCGRCGYTACIQALQLHHVNPLAKCFALRGQIRRWSALVAEARKCVCLCSNCHAEFHAGLWHDTAALPRFDEHYAEELPRTARNNGRVRGNWSAIDLRAALQGGQPNFSAIGRLVGVSGTSVRKRARKLGYL